MRRFRRSAHVTPKSFMTFLNLYKSLYSERSSEIAELAERMDSGLEKLQEASTSVSKLKAELFVMEKDLKVASEKAGEVRRLYLSFIPARRPNIDEF